MPTKAADSAFPATPTIVQMSADAVAANETALAKIAVEISFFISSCSVLVASTSRACAEQKTVARGSEFDHYANADKSDIGPSERLIEPPIVCHR